MKIQYQITCGLLKFFVGSVIFLSLPFLAVLNQTNVSAQTGNCDVNSDSEINDRDRELISDRNGVRPGDIRWSPTYDINGDRVIDRWDVNACFPEFVASCDVNHNGTNDENDVALIQRDEIDTDGDGDYDNNDWENCYASIGQAVGSLQTGIGRIRTDPGGFVSDILSVAIGVAGGIAFILMVVGAIRMLVSAGDPESLAAGREMLTSAIAGLLFIIFSVVILRIIGIQVLHIPFFR